MLQDNREESPAVTWASPRLTGPSPAAIASLLLLLAVVLAGCKPKEKVAPPAGTKTSDVRVYGQLPEYILKNQVGVDFGSDNLWGRVYIANFIFTRCGATCPTQTKVLAALQNELAGKISASDLHYISISVDPEHDTPEVLKKYADEYGADTSTWSFLTGGRKRIWELAKDGFKQSVFAGSGDTPGTLITHSPKFTLVDRMGRMRGFYDSTNADDMAQLKPDLEAVLAESWEPRYGDPPEIFHPTWMGPRREAQLATVEQFDVFHDFQYTDRLPESGITFVHRAVDDAGKDYKGVHYDHGNGVAIADVDGDGKLDLYFTNQVGANELWKNLGDGKFENVTELAGVAVDDRISVAGSFADVDNDGDADLYVTAVRDGNVLFLNDGSGKFTDVSAESGLGYQGHSAAAVFFDYDRDGLLDLLLTNVGVYTTDEKGRGDYWIGHSDAFGGHLKPEREERNRIYRNLGGAKFKDVSDELGFDDKSWTGAASPLDANNDGWPDIYLTDMQGHDEYYENVAGKKFVKKSRELFPATSWGAMSIKVFDYNNDGLQDIFITDMHTDMTFIATPEEEKKKVPEDKMYPASLLATDLNHVRGNSFFRNLGDGKYEEASDELGAENFWPWGITVADLNADGFEDVFVASSMSFHWRYGVNTVLLNNLGKKFLDSEFILGVEPRRGHQTAIYWDTIDCDGADKETLLCQDYEGRKALTGVNQIWGALGTRATVIFDLDDDGDLDIVSSEFHAAPMVLMSNLSEKQPELNWLKIKLVGKKSNRDGLGATVRITAGDATYTRVHDGKSGYISQSSYPLYVGLGAAKQVDQIEVTWPDGSTQTVAGPIEGGQLLTIEEE